jgi:hypothetical protein
VFGYNQDFRNDSSKTNNIKRFEHIWIQDLQSFNIIKDAWTNSNSDITSKLHYTFNTVYQWGQEVYGNIPREIKTLQQDIHDKKTKIPSREDIDNIHQLEKTLDNFMKIEETWWAQRAKAHWLQHGDKNSKFFHYKASQGKRKNKNNFIINQQGNRATDNKEIQSAFMDYFTNIFSSSNPTNISESMTGVANRVTPQMHDLLNKDFSAAEVS